MTGRAAVVTCECQVGVLGEPAVFPALAAAARASGVVEAAARVVGAARAAGVPVVHALALRRDDGLGSNTNARLFRAAARAPVALTPGSPAAAVVPEIGVEPTDLVSARLHGLGPMSGGGLDPLLRNLGVEEVVVVGVSVNVAVTELVIGAVDAGYRVTLVRDAVAGVPHDYADAVVEHTLALLADVVTSHDVVARWVPSRT